MKEQFSYRVVETGFAFFSAAHHVARLEIKDTLYKLRQRVLGVAMSSYEDVLWRLSR